MVSCWICGRSGEPDPPDELNRLAEQEEKPSPGQWAVVLVRGVIPGLYGEVLVCSITCAVTATLQKAIEAGVRDVPRGGQAA